MDAMSHGPNRIPSQLRFPPPPKFLQHTSAAKAHVSTAAANSSVGACACAGAGAASYPGRERMLAYSNAGKAEKICRRLAILEKEARG